MERLTPRERIQRYHPNLLPLILGNDPWKDYDNPEEIGSGTYGMVWKATHKKTKHVAAIKRVNIEPKDDIAAILQEIFTMRDIKHKNIVDFYGAYLSSERSGNCKLHMAMEFCDGGSLQDIYTKTHKPVDERCIAFICRETLDGLAAMHLKGKMHRDIKGANILLNSAGAVKLADFGVSAQISETLGRRSTFIGTPFWMAPEVADVARRGGYNAKCDVWAVGITAIELAELEPPMFNLHPMKVLHLMTKRNYTAPKLKNQGQWSKKFHTFLELALRKDPRKRPTPREMLQHPFVADPELSPNSAKGLLRLYRQLCRPSLLLGRPYGLPEQDSDDEIHPSAPAPQPLERIHSQRAAKKEESPHRPGPSRAAPSPQVPPRPSPVPSESNRQPRPQRRKENNHHPPQPQHREPPPQVPPHKPPTKQPDRPPRRRPYQPQQTPVSKPIVMEDRRTPAGDAYEDVSTTSEISEGRASSVESNTSGSSADQLRRRGSSNGSSEYYSDDLLSEGLQAVEIGERDEQTISPPVTQAEENPYDQLWVFSQGKSDAALVPTPKQRERPRSLLEDIEDALESKWGHNNGAEAPGLFGSMEDIPGNKAPAVPPRQQSEEVQERPGPSKPPKPGSLDPKRRSKSQDCLVESEDTVSPVKEKLVELRNRKLQDKRAWLQGHQSVAVENILFNNGASFTPPGNGRKPASNRPQSAALSTSSPAATGEHQAPPQVPERKTSAGPPRPPPPKNRKGLGNHASPAAPAPPKVKMGAGFQKLFEGCPLKINWLSKWRHPGSKDEYLLVAANEGIYALNLLELQDAELFLIFPRACRWIFVIRDVMMSLSGQNQQLYRHDLLAIFDTKRSSGVGSKVKSIVPKRYRDSPHTKVPRTKNCMKVCVKKSPFSGFRWLACALPDEILLMEWFEPMRKFMELKSIKGVQLPSPLNLFEMLIMPDDMTGEDTRAKHPLPLLCVGVTTHQGREERVQFKLLNLNREDGLDGNCSSSSNTPMMAEDGERYLDVTNVTQLEKDTILISYRNCSKVVGLNGVLKSAGKHSNRVPVLEFQYSIDNIQCVDETVLGFYKHGFQGRSFIKNEIVQDIHDEQHIYRLLGFSDLNPVLERRRSDDPMGDSDLLMVIGHTS